MLIKNTRSGDLKLVGDKIRQCNTCSSTDTDAMVLKVIEDKNVVTILVCFFIFQEMEFHILQYYHVFIFKNYSLFIYLGNCCLQGNDEKILIGKKQLHTDRCSGGNDVEAHVFCSIEIKPLQRSHQPSVNYDLFELFCNRLTSDKTIIERQSPLVSRSWLPRIRIKKGNFTIRNLYMSIICYRNN